MNFKIGDKVLLTKKIYSNPDMLNYVNNHFDEPLTVVGFNDLGLFLHHESFLGINDRAFHMGIIKNCWWYTYLVITLYKPKYKLIKKRTYIHKAK